jgi:hypothetical protein
MGRAGNNPAAEMSSGRTPVSLRIFVFACIFLLVSGAQLLARAQTTADEYQVKAAFLFHFAQFVDWPAGALDAKGPTLNLCIFDDEPHRQQLQSTIEGKVIGGRVFHVLLISPPQAIQGCNILFLSRDESRRQTAILRSLRGLPVLSVGETANFLSDGGMICFHFEGDRIRFDINLGAVDSSHLKISSRLLLLATSVTRGGRTGQGR